MYTNVRLGAADFPIVNYDYYHHHHHHHCAVVRLQVPLRDVLRLTRILVMCPAHVNFRLPTSFITSTTLVSSLTQLFVSVPARDV